MEFFTAISLFNRRKFDECTAICTALLKKRPLDQVKSQVIKNFYYFFLYQTINIKLIIKFNVNQLNKNFNSSC